MENLSQSDDPHFIRSGATLKNNQNNNNSNNAHNQTLQAMRYADAGPKEESTISIL